MQKSLKMISRISSAPTRPVIRPRLTRANRTPSAARARSMSRYRWYWARAAKHCCRWALWRAWVRVGAQDRGLPHLERKLKNKMIEIELPVCPLERMDIPIKQLHCFFRQYCPLWDHFMTSYRYYDLYDILYVHLRASLLLNIHIYVIYYNVFNEILDI